jgi:hypothetical protein
MGPAMNSRLGRDRALRAIERDLVRSDPRLNALFLALTGLAAGKKMPDTEKIRTGPFRQLAWLGRRTDHHRGG